jgi:regulator of sigma E protease
MEQFSHLLPALMSIQAQAAEQSGGINPIFTILIFLGMLVVLVFVHELGHFLMALWMGIRVEEFGIGFPPRALTLYKRNGVVYTLNWIPLGGFVRFAGEDNVYSGGTTRKSTEGDAGSAEAAGTALTEAPPLRKIPVMVAGPFANLLVAVLIFAAMAMTVGINVPTGKGQVINEVFADTPAEEAGFQEGDILVQLDGQPVSNTSDIPQISSDNPNQPIEAVVERDGREVTLTVTPAAWSVPGGPSSEMGLGFRFEMDIQEMQTSNPLAAIGISIEHTGRVLVAFANGLGRMIGGLVGANEPPPGGLTGPVGIARATGEIIDAGGLIAFWNWMAIISLNLFLLNLLPIPALDGSHIMFALVEIARGGKKLPPEKEAMVHAIGFAALMGLIVIVSVSDVLNAIQGNPVIPGQ